MPFLTIEVIGTPRSRIMEYPIEVSGFGGNASFTLGYVNLDLTIKPMPAATLSMSLMLTSQIICYSGDFKSTSTRLCASHSVNASTPFRKSIKFMSMPLSSNLKYELIS